MQQTIYRDLAMRMYKHTVVSGGCSGSCYIIDSTVSPYEGKSGMCYEFAAADAGGCRSLARYCYDGWCNNVLTAAGLQVFGLWGDAGMRDSIMERMQNGSGDLVYKLQHGYHGRSNGEFKDHTESSVENLGYRYVKQVYEKVVRAADDVTALKQAGRISAFTTRTGNAGRYDLAGRRLRRPVTGITCRVASRTSVRLEVCQ